MRDLFELRAAYEQRTRLVRALKTARQKLNKKDFELFSPQLNEKIRELDKAIEDYEQIVLAATTPHQLAAVCYKTYRIGGRIATPLQPSIFTGLPSSGTFLVGFGDPGRPDQMCLPWRG